jgi:hypothetical protein
MTNLGVFRDEYYNAIHALAEAQANTGPTASGVVGAALLAGAAECYVSLAGTSQTFTTDTAANIIAQLQTAVAAAQKANVGGFASALGSTPPLGVPNLFNLSWVINFSGAGIVTGGTLAPGTGVTLSNIGTTLSSTALAIGGVSVYVATVTGAASVTLTRVQ